jgi:hypothetical protein
VQAFDRNGAVTWTPDQDAARSALVDRWKADSAADPQASRFVFAYTNAEVDRLNAELRQVRRDRGELDSPDVVLETKHGAMAFAVGDQVQFTDTAKKLGIYNGNTGTIIDIDAATGQVTARLDVVAKKEGRAVAWDAEEFQGFRHGYAGTIYKGQGKTLDHTYLLHTHHWRAAASYVALTRQRESAQVFVATETARDGRELARQMARGEVRAASVAWATADEVAAARPSPRPDPADRAPPRQEQPDPPREADTPRQTETPVAQPRSETGVPDTGWLIPPYVDPTGRDRDSLGRGASAGEIAAAVAADKRVQLEREARWSYLQGAYRDPHAARAALDELVKREGWTSAASRIAGDPDQLGELRGKVGWLASGTAKQERARAERAASALPGSLQRIGDAEGTAARAYWSGMEAQRGADRTGVPRLSADAEAALAARHAARDQAARGEVWQAVEKSGAIAAELAEFRQAVERRFGAEGVWQILRTEGRAGAVNAPSVAAGQRAALDQIAERVSTMWVGEKAASLAQHQAEREQLG